MNTTLAAALLFAALGLVAAHHSIRTAAIALLLASLAGLGVSFVAVPESLRDIILIGAWVSVAITALLVFPATLRDVKPMVLAIAVNAGAWSGLLASFRPDLASTLTVLAFGISGFAILLPAKMLLRTPLRLGLRIVASWLVAVSVLAAGLPLIPTPGYEPDHMQ